jgi:hypothetical protein
VTNKELNTIARGITRARNQTIRLAQHLDDLARPEAYPEIGDPLDTAAEQLALALRKLESVLDDMDAPVPPEASRVR